MEKWKVELEALQQQILKEINPILLSNTAMMDVDNWFISHPTISKQIQDDAIIFTNATDKANYVSLLEKNTFFKSAPKNSINVMPYENISVALDVEIVGKATVHIAIIEYQEGKKGRSMLYPVNQTMSHPVSEETDQIRVAIKISGKGLIIVKSGEIKRVEESFKSTPVVTTVKRKKTTISHTKELNVAVIFDEFTMNCYQKEVNVITFTPDNFQEVLENNPPDFLFVESAWRGNGGSWEFKIAKYDNQDKEPLHQLIKWCNQREIPTVFWNKEDPIHYDKFIETAELFDYIYTTDAQIIGKYQERTNHQNVFALPFSAQPELHNPIRLTTERKNAVSFAGSYYGNRHIERRNDMEEVLDSAAILGLDIFDRNYEKNKLGPTNFSFPDRFQDKVKGSLPYNKIAIAYKGYRYMANVNSIKHSPTMFSRRIFEGLASGTPIISSYSDGLSQMFGDIVMIGDETESLGDKFRRVLEDDRLYKKKQLAGIREVMQNHTYQNRLSFILKNLGIEFTIKEDVTLIINVSTEEEVKAAIKLFKKQRYQQKKLALLADLTPENAFIVNKYQSADIAIYLRSYMKEFNHFTDICQTKYVTYINLAHFYGKYYIQDLVLAAIYSKADIVTKNNYFEWKDNEIQERSTDLEFQYCNSGEFGRALFRTDYRSIKTLDELLTRMEKNITLGREFRTGKSIFSIDNGNFIKYGNQCSKKLTKQLEY